MRSGKKTSAGFYPHLSVSKSFVKFCVFLPLSFLSFPPSLPPSLLVTSSSLSQLISSYPPCHLFLSPPFFTSLLPLLHSTVPHPFIPPSNPSLPHSLPSPSNQSFSSLPPPPPPLLLHSSLLPSIPPHPPAPPPLFYSDIVDVKGLDIFGNSPASLKKCVNCVCPNCSRTLGAQKFAPHLEKCMGMGRNSSRLANRKNKTPLDSDQEVSDDNEDEWTYPERKTTAKLRKEKLMTNSPRKPGTRGPGRPPKHTPRELESTSSHHIKPSLQQHNVTSFNALPTDCKQSLLQQICGVVSERTGRLCTRSVNCPQHTEDQRLDVRRKLLFEQHSFDQLAPPPKRARESGVHKSQGEDDLDIESHYDSVLSHHLPDPTPSSNPSLVSSRKRKMKSGKRSKKGHSSVTMTTALHSSPGHMY